MRALWKEGLHPHFVPAGPVDRVQFDRVVPDFAVPLAVRAARRPRPRRL